jgi:serine/threonine protein kinase
MPDNTWYTPYKFTAWTCLSSGPSQGIVYQFSEKTVVKVPFQYPVNGALPADEANEKIYMSLRSFAIFKKESTFYDMLTKKPHPNLAQKLQGKQPSSIILQRFRPLEQAWSSNTKEMHVIWIQNLLSALEWLENLGYTHGDLTVRNMGIDENNRLRLFDFGSIRHCDDEGFYEQVLEDHFTLATCIHFLASGIDPVAKAKSVAEVRRTFHTLQAGQGLVDEAAKDFEEVIQAGWTKIPRPSSSFSQLRQDVTGNIRYISTSGAHQSANLSSWPQLVCDELMVEDPRWMDEKDYRAAWKAEGFETPDDIWS